MQAEVGDKIRLKNHSNDGQRGVIERVSTSSVVVRISETNELLRVNPACVTNYSLAARKAWEKMPDKRVGRPKGSVTTDRVSVTLRVDREIWEQFQLAEAAGFIPDRTATVNKVLRQELKKIEQRKRSLSLREEG